jgi:hypothetical protein
VVEYKCLLVNSTVGTGIAECELYIMNR